MKRFSVSKAEAFRKWREDEDAELEPLLAILRGESPPTEPMLAGTALHKALETANEGERESLSADGYEFLITADINLALPKCREIFATKDYGPIVISSRVDVLDGKRVEDHKTTGRFDPDRFLNGYQWRFYLDIFEADLFRWNVFEMRELKPKVYEVFNFHRLEQCRYPALAMDCRDLAEDLAAFVREYLPEMCADEAIAA
ncbi:MAG: hypothetical protein ACTHMO_05520 [Rhodanobacteraceae bacterium]